MKKGWSGDQIISRNFDLMINLSTSWKSWILISWNLTSWPRNYYRSCLKSIYLKIKLLFEVTTLANENLTMVKDTKCNSNIRHIFPSFSWKLFRIFLNPFYFVRRECSSAAALLHLKIETMSVLCISQNLLVRQHRMKSPTDDENF